MKTSLKITLVLLAAGCLALSASAQTRLATVDLGKVFDNYWKTKQAEAALKDRGADLEKEHKGMVEDFKKGNEEYQKLLASANDQAVSTEERDKRKKNAETKLKELKDLQETIAQYERQARVTLDEQRVRMRKNLIEEIKVAVSSKAKASGYTLVLDKDAISAANNPVFLYTSNDSDITDTVLEQLNVTAPKEASGLEKKN